MNATYFSSDIEEFLRLLGIHRVRYVIVGGEAVIYYGYARLTGDIDIFYEVSSENVVKLYKALTEFWSDDIPGIESAEELLEMGLIIQFGVPPNRIDLINRIDGVTFQEAWDGRKTTVLEGQQESIPIYFIGINELIKNKEALRRYKDLDDLRYLREAKDPNEK